MTMWKPIFVSPRTAIFNRHANKSDGLGEQRVIKKPTPPLSTVEAECRDVPPLTPVTAVTTSLEDACMGTA